VAIEVLNSKDLSGWPTARLREAEETTRRKLAEIRMDLYVPANSQTGNIRKLKKNLARLLTAKASLKTNSK
jgi:ribosomal protein L29